MVKRKVNKRVNRSKRPKRKSDRKLRIDGAVITGVQKLPKGYAFVIKRGDKQLLAKGRFKTLEGVKRKLRSL